MNPRVLILIVVDNGLIQLKAVLTELNKAVLILIVVDNGLILLVHVMLQLMSICLNPYCSGQWSHTFYATAGQYIIMES